MSASLEALLESWSNEFLARIDRIRSLIGDAHWHTDGMHKERLLQAFITSRLPTTVAAGHGFLVDPSNDLCSREIDVLIRDCLHSAPLLDESGITICDPQSVQAYLEVKSNLTAATLEASLTLIRETQELIAHSNDAANVWRAICFTGEKDERSDESLIETIAEKVSQSCDRMSAGANAHAAFLPVCILCLDRFVLFVGSNQSTGKRCRLRYFPARRLSFAIAMSDMLSFVYSRAGIRSFQPLEKGVEQVVRVSPIFREV